MEIKLNKLIPVIVILILNAGLIGCVTSENATKPPNVIVGETVTSIHFDGIETDSSNHQFNIQPMFKIEAVNFHAFDETGWTNWGSDEVYGVWRVSGFGGARTFTYGGVDAGETRTFHEFQSCIYPILGGAFINGEQDQDGLSEGWQCAEQGGRAPVSIKISLYDADDISFPVCFECDDLIGSHIKDWTLQELLTILPNPGDEKPFSVKMFLCPKNTVCNTNIGNSDYRFLYTITRMQNKLIPIQSSQ